MENRTNAPPLAREGGGSAKRSMIIVAAVALCLGAAFLALTLILASCSASVASAIKPDGSARVAADAEMPAVLAAKIRKLESAGNRSPTAAPAAVLDARAIGKALADKPGIDLLEASQPSPDSIRIRLSVRSIAELAASPDLKGSSLLSLERGPGWTECRVRLVRGEAKAIAALLPGIDPGLLEALSPPALEDDPVGLEDYKAMLKSVFGEKSMPAIEAAAIKLSISAPGPVLAYGGGSLAGSTLSTSIPMLDVLALEKPIELRLRWKDGQ